jgi:hypothetical protein
MQGETRARFLIDSIRMLAQHHAKDSPIMKLTMSHLVPVGVDRDGTLGAAAAIDYLYWDKNTAEFSQRREFSGKRRVVLVAGPASTTATKAFAAAGITLRPDLRPR